MMALAGSFHSQLFYNQINKTLGGNKMVQILITFINYY